MHRYIEKIKPCPDRTHIRLYFDGYHFLAISADCEIMATDEGLTAYDPVGCLYYEIRKDCAK
ncbi:hypothetical protein LCY76_21095 [Fictibacillus sp. KIGAM418]|uniref:Uncharacterized protein n=1 Tax=Fictibacillus marinisediminis TaxID=2878389 RepID=A0A9X1XE76_9BACL|nr:hypothetical protein [Fictibacillus marinisediminis]MCK6259071.1 hypothetical protein [Fictibacillus marinisediminis]